MISSALRRYKSASAGFHLPTPASSCHLLTTYRILPDSNLLQSNGYLPLFPLSSRLSRNGGVLVYATGRLILGGGDASVDLVLGVRMAGGGLYSDSREVLG